MSVLNLTTNASSSVGSTAYNWTYTQNTGSVVANTSLTNNTTNVSTFNYPAAITYVPGGTSGTYSFVFQCSATDSGVANCVAIKDITLFFNVTPPSCTITLSNITVA